MLHLSADAGDLGRLYPWLDAEAAALHLPGATLHGMHVVLEEVVANAAMHAFAPGERGEITVRLDLSAEVASLVVEDTGRRFDPTTAPVPERKASLDDMEPGGLGLVLLRHYCRDISYERIHDRNRLTLRFPLPAPPEGAS